MSDASKIEWCDASWNCVTGCTKVSAGCDHCYAETFAERWRGIKGHHFEQGFNVRLWYDRLEIPLHWKRPRRIFVNSMSDVFHEKVPDRFIATMFAVMAATPQHTYQVLTKRHGRMRSLLRSEVFWQHVKGAAGDLGLQDRVPLAMDGGGVPQVVRPIPGVWLGVSAEDQKWADIRIPALLDTPAAVRFVSAEPLLGPIDLDPYLWLQGGSTAGPFRDYAGRRRCGGGVGGQALTRVKANDLHWVIAGGESGAGARPCELDWLRSLASQCQEAGTPVFVKQMGAMLGRELAAGSKGGNISRWPMDLRVRQFPVPATAGAR